MNKDDSTKKILEGTVVEVSFDQGKNWYKIRHAFNGHFIEEWAPEENLVNSRLK